MPLDVDKRMRCSFNTGGTETYRFSSSKNAFGSGGNLQNIPSGTEDEEKHLNTFVFPNLRRMFKPDPGFTLFDVDLAGADAQVVAWEADDQDLKAKFRSGEKIHALNAKDMYGKDAGPDGMRKPYYKKAKMGTHLTNYGGKPPTLSKALGMTMHEAELFQRRWFQMHPNIKLWHEEIENKLMTTRCVWNKFGFRRFYPDRIQGLLPEALAWIPQSTIAIVINHGLCAIAESNTSMELLLQVHDSLVGQMPKTDTYLNLPILQNALRVTVPYSDPLVIATSLDMSDKSWGDLQSVKWPSSNA
jgi:DNA polymerase I-like protein with 3'-5' exonuclease and polymerase domains